MTATDPSILVVDDSLAMRRVMRNILEEMGIPSGAVIEARDGAEALQYLAEHVGKVQLVLADWIMPVVDGLELLRRMKRAEEMRGIPVIMVTCQSQTDLVVQAIREGARNYITKPFRSETLQRKVQDALGAEFRADAARRTLSVLVVDDSETMRKLVISALREIPGIEAKTLEAADGVEAIGLLNRTPDPVHLVIADWEMPNMDGLELLRQLKVSKRYQGVPVMIVTSVSRHERAQEAIRSGACAYLIKPFRPQVLRDRVLEAIAPQDKQDAPPEVIALRSALTDAARGESTNLPFLDALPDGLRKAFERHSKRTTHFAGAVLVRPKETVDSLHVVETGEVEVLSETADRVVEVRKPGDCFGHSSFLSGDPALRMARAKTEVAVLSLEKATFEKVLQDHPELGIYLTRLLARQSVKNTARIWSKVGIGLSGHLGAMSMVDVLQTLHSGLKTGLLRISREADSAEVYLVEGEVQHARCAGLEGEKAVHSLLRWTRGSFSFQAGPRDLAAQELPSTMQLLMEGMRLLDESSRNPAPPA